MHVPWNALGLAQAPSVPRLWVNFFRCRGRSREELFWAARYGSRPNWTQLGVLQLTRD